MIDYNNIILSDKKPDEEYVFNGFNFYSSSFNTNWFRELNIEPTTILEIGSYDFGDSIRFRLEFENCQIFAFEADIDRYKKTHIYAESIGVKTFNKVVYNNTGSVDFYRSVCNIKDAGTFHSPGEFGGQGSIYKHNQKYRQRFSHIQQLKEPFKMDSICIKDFCDEKKISDISLAHIDVEGAEIDVLNGFGDMRPKLIFIEIQDNLFENGFDKEDVFNLLDNMGYHLLKDYGVDKLYVYKN